MPARSLAFIKVRIKGGDTRVSLTDVWDVWSLQKLEVKVEGTGPLGCKRGLMSGV